MMLNQDKCHFLFSGHKYKTLFVNVGETKISERKQQKLSDRDLKVDEYVLSQCKKAGKKLTALIRISKFMTFAQRRNIMKDFIESQFGYCETERQTDAWINHIPEGTLRAVYNDEMSPFEELLGKHKSETIHRRNIKILAAELFKIKNDLSNDIMAQLICKRNSVGYSLRSQTDFSLLQVKSVNYGLKALRYFGPKIWNILPSDIKSSRTLQEFSKIVKSWFPRNCPCRICEGYRYQVGFTNIHDS